MTTSNAQSKELLSVVIPVFNTERYLTDLIKSLKQQTLKNFEVLFIDDGSTDNSAEVITRLTCTDKRFKLFKQKNRGPSVARNNGLTLSTGSWIIFVDSDDYLPPTSLESLFECTRKSSPDVVITNAYKFESDPDSVTQTEILIKQPWGKCISGRDWVIYTTKTNNWRHYIWTHLYRKDFLNENHLRFEPNLLHEDILWCSNMALRAKKIIFENVITYGYRSNHESLIGSLDRRRIEHRLDSYHLVIHTLINIGSTQMDRKLGKAFHRQAIFESGHMTGLLRKKISPNSKTANIASKFLESNSIFILLKAARNPSEFWKVVRLAIALKKHQRCGKDL